MTNERPPQFLSLAASQQRAVTLLTEAVNLLRSPGTTTVPTTRSDPTTATATSSSTTSPQSELNRLFSPYNSRNFIGKSRPSTSSGSKYYEVTRQPAAGYLVFTCRTK